MMNRRGFKYSFLAEIMTRALTLTPGANNRHDVEVLHDVMTSKSGASPAAYDASIVVS
jgi:hypothetical protein